MVGTGVFVSVGIAAGVAGPAVLAAVVIAGLLAMANGLSSAQLASAHPVSGGTYEYGYLWLSPLLGFSAGWMFMLAKSASAATAALGFSGYLLDMVGVAAPGARVTVAAGTALLITAFVAGGIRRSNRGNAIVVCLSLAGLVALVVAALPTLLDRGLEPFIPFLGAGDGAVGAGDGAAGAGGGAVGAGASSVGGNARSAGAGAAGVGPAGTGAGLVALLHGSALMFVAFTGYGRVATLGEEVRNPRRVIPRAIVATVGVVALLYLAVAATGVGVLGASAFGRTAQENAAPLEAVARSLGYDWLEWVVAAAAVAAMAGVLLNLVLGLSRVLLAMARRGDAPKALASVDARRASPVAAVWACGVLVAGIALVGDVRTTWSFSAFTVLIYYSVTNLAALRLPATERLFPRWIPAAGLAGCLGLAFWVEPVYWLVGSGLLAAGIAGHILLGAGRSGPAG
jgi:APA family basic amino acid/polyamine antiporter